MGSPLAGVLAEIYLQNFEKIKLFPSFDKFGIKNFFRYVDDVFILKDKNSSKTSLDFVNGINTLDKNLKFTFEKENNDRLNLFGCVSNLERRQIWN